MRYGIARIKMSLNTDKPKEMYFICKALIMVSLRLDENRTGIMSVFKLLGVTYNLP